MTLKIPCAAASVILLSPTESTCNNFALFSRSVRQKVIFFCFVFTGSVSQKVEKSKVAFWAAGPHLPTFDADTVWKQGHCGTKGVAQDQAMLSSKHNFKVSPVTLVFWVMRALQLV